MTHLKPLSLAFTMSCLLASCGGDDGRNGAAGANGTNGTDGTNGMNSLVQQITLNSGDVNCRFGGVQINSGMDDNGNNSLDAGEVGETNFVCQDGVFQLQLLHFADVDGGRDIINNAIRFSALLDNFRDEYSNTLVLSSGDNWIPGPEYNVASDDTLADVLGVTDTGRAHLAYLNAMGVQASAFGNHEFDLGTGEIAGLLSSEEDEGNLWVGAQFPYLSANIDFSTDDNLTGLVGTDGASNHALRNQIAASTTINVNGHLVGIVGATTPILGNISSPGDVTIRPATDDVADLAAVIQPAIDALIDAGVNKIILLAHMQQLAIERELAELLDGVDIIVAGGSNTLLADGNDRLRDGDAAADTYPLSYDSASNEPVLVINTDGDFTYLGRLIVNFDTQGQIITNMLDDAINGAYATDETGLVENGLSTEDVIDGVADVSDALTTALSARAGNVFGLTNVYLNGERGSVRTEETNLGSLTAHANLVYAQDSDDSVTISIKNGGGIRAPIGFCNVPAGATGDDALVCSAPAGIEGINNPGEISQLDLEIALRFNNRLSLVTVTGGQLKEILEHGVAGTEDGATPGRFPQVAGIRFSFDASETAQTVDTSGDQPVVSTEGSRIRNLIVLDENGAQDGGDSVIVVSDGVLDPTAAIQTFRLVTLGFIAGGGDSYPFPADGAANVVDLEMENVQTGSQTFADDGTEQDAFAEYLNANFPADDDDATPAYSVEDVGAASDITIQNLDEVPFDTVLAE